MAEMIDPENWQAEAKRVQCEFYATLRHEVAWRGVATEMKHSLQLMLAKNIFNRNENDGGTLTDLGLSRTEIATVRIISNKIIKYFSDQFLHIYVIIIFGKWKKTAWNDVVFRVEGGGDTKFIDSRFRVYSDWNSFLANNTLQPGLMCYPANGRYTLSPEGLEVLVEFGSTPNSSKKNRTLVKCKLIASLAIFVGLILEAIYASMPDVTILLIIGLIFGLSGILYLLVSSIIGFFDALKYS